MGQYSLPTAAHWNHLGNFYNTNPGPSPRESNGIGVGWGLTGGKAFKKKKKNSQMFLLFGQDWLVSLTLLIKSVPLSCL